MNFSKIVVSISILIFSFQLNAQIVGAGIQPKLTLSRQINVVQEIPKKFARSAESFLSSPGCELFADYSLSTRWRLRLKAGLETRGYVSQYPSISVDRRAQKFKHISTSLSALFYFRKDSPIRPYLLAGVHSGYLYQSEVVEELITLDGTYYTPANINHSDYAHFNLSGTGGFGIDFHDKLWLECSYNRDLIAPLQNAQLKAFNSMYSFNVGINLLNWFKK